jgi:hypothetical protein
LDIFGFERSEVFMEILGRRIKAVVIGNGGIGGDCKN